MGEADPFLRRLERDALIACGVLVAAAVALTGDVRAGAAVLGGGVLAAVSYRSIKGVVHGAPGRRPRAFTLVKFFTRYGILALAAYVMLARLRLPPVGVMAGASAFVIAALAAAVRTPGAPSRTRPHRRPRALDRNAH
jgi:hypothetical protein